MSLLGSAAGTLRPLTQSSLWRRSRPLAPVTLSACLGLVLVTLSLLGCSKMCRRLKSARAPTLTVPSTATSCVPAIVPVTVVVPRTIARLCAKFCAAATIALPLMVALLSSSVLWAAVWAWATVTSPCTVPLVTRKRLRSALALWLWAASTEPCTVPSMLTEL